MEGTPETVAPTEINVPKSIESVDPETLTPEQQEQSAKYTSIRAGEVGQAIVNKILEDHKNIYNFEIYDMIMAHTELTVEEKLGLAFNLGRWISDYTENQRRKSSPLHMLKDLIEEMDAARQGKVDESNKLSDEEENAHVPEQPLADAGDSTMSMIK